ATWLFGPWFTSEKFPDRWSLDALEKFVEVQPIVEPDDDVVKRLSALVSVNIESVVRILEHMVKGDREGWRVYTWIGHARTILTKAIGEQGEARKVAVRIIEHL